MEELAELDFQAMEEALVEGGWLKILRISEGLLLAAWREVSEVVSCQ